MRHPAPPDIFHDDLLLGMSSTTRILRSSSAALTSPAPTSKPSAAVVPSPIAFETPPSSFHEPIHLFPPGVKLPGLKPAELALLRKKQRQLSSTAPTTLSSLPNPKHLNALLSTLIFAQHEAGTAVCIHPSGWLLTCAHCFGEDEGEYRSDSKRRWLLFYTGQAVLVECRVWDGRGDLALLKVVGIEADYHAAQVGKVLVFSYLKVTEGIPKPRLEIICVGQPGRDDLEAEGNKKTKYNLVEISEGRFRGMVKGKNPMDNGEIGTLMHDAWTYWGHSGAPLVSVGEGKLVGLHSSWDDETAMRHGVPGVAVREFLGECLPGIRELWTSEDML